MAGRTRALAGVLLLAAFPLTAGAQSKDETDALMDRVTAWVHQWVSAYTNVVAEEVYVQETTSPRRKRTLRSDYMLVRFPGAQEWHTFRDVVEVDGKPVGEQGRTERMMKLFVEPPENVRRRIDDIAMAGARYNLIDIGSMNDPLRVVAFLQAGYREQFRFTRAGLERDLGASVRVVRFEEFRRPTILRRGSSGGNDLPSYGLIWVDELTGRVVKTELRPGRFSPPTIRLVTTFRFDQQLGIDVPAVMEDLYPDRTGEFRGTATYANFRRFQATVREEIAVPPNPR